jgi:hypothetical protein
VIALSTQAATPVLALQRPTGTTDSCSIRALYCARMLGTPCSLASAAISSTHYWRPSRAHEARVAAGQAAQYKAQITEALSCGTSPLLLQLNPPPQVPAPNQQYALSAPLPRPLVPATAGLVVQYEAQITETHGCGGAYLKLLVHDPEWQPRKLSRRTPYALMFGPDRCGADARVGPRAGGQACGQPRPSLRMRASAGPARPPGRRAPRPCSAPPRAAPSLTRTPSLTRPVSLQPHPPRFM